MVVERWWWWIYVVVVDAILTPSVDGVVER